MHMRTFLQVRRQFFFPPPRNLSEEQVVYNDPDINLVIPAKAGIQAAYPSSGDNYAPPDSRFRGNDEGKAVPPAQGS